MTTTVWLAGVPTHLIRADLLYKRVNGFYAGANIEWMPKSYYADNANTTALDPNCLLNFRLGFELFASRWSVYVEGRNLFDKRYISTVDVAGTDTAASQILYPGSGRPIRVGVQYDL